MTPTIPKPPQPRLIHRSDLPDRKLRGGRGRPLSPRQAYINASVDQATPLLIGVLESATGNPEADQAVHLVFDVNDAECLRLAADTQRLVKDYNRRALLKALKRVEVPERLRPEGGGNPWSVEYDWHVDVGADGKAVSKRWEAAVSSWKTREGGA